MECEDDMIVVIIGDEDENNSITEIKTEVLEEGDDYQNIEDLMYTAETYGEVIKLEPSSVDEESPGYEDDYLELPIEESFVKEEQTDYDSDFQEQLPDIEIKSECDDDDVDYIPEEEGIEDKSDIETEVMKRKERRRPTMLKPWQQKSFVQELRQQYPELRNDKNSIISTLSEIMKTVKPPPPPLDYYIMNGILLECIICHSFSETIPAAGRHYQEKHGPRYLICYACGVDFRSTTNLYKHEKRCNAPDADIVLKARAQCLGRNGPKRPYPPLTGPANSKKYSCQQCSAKFVTKNLLLSHEYLHMGVRPFHCSNCPSAYTSKAALRKHMKKHGDEKFVCDHCQRVFKMKAALVTHMYTHRPEKRFVCEECGKGYANKFAFVLHVDGKHRNLPPPCACQLCPKRFRRTSLLKDHMKKAHGMELITRKMFFKTLPNLTEMQIKNAKVVFKNEEQMISNDQ